MCGVIGYIGKGTDSTFFYNGLKTLEYRGYDSAGIAMSSKEGMQVVRAEGKLTALKARLSELPQSTHAGIGHTRWATHGAPSEANAHPHTSGPIVLLHNGIIENFQPLKNKLEREGFTFLSDTDTEVAAHLIHFEYNQRAHLKDSHQRMKESLCEALRQIHGAYAFALLCSESPNYLYAAKQGSPMVIGRGDGENYLASGIPALVSHTKEIARLEDGDIAILSQEAIELFDRNLQTVSRPFFTVEMTPEMLEKDGFDHFMQKEIWQHPLAVRSVMEGRINDSGTITAESLGISALNLDNIDRIQCIACGTSYYACMAGKYFIEEYCGIPVDVELASEFRYKAPVLSKNTLALAISQSGETIDTLFALTFAKEQGAQALGLVNAQGSSIEYECDACILLRAGVEVGVASTKAFSAQITALSMFGIALAQHRKPEEQAQHRQVVQWLQRVPGMMDSILETNTTIEEMAKSFLTSAGFLFIGRGAQWSIALEGALKLKELAYVFAEAYAGGELKHGPLALIDENSWIVALAPRDKHFEKMISNIAEVKARGGKILGIGTEGDSELEEMVDLFIGVPACSSDVLPLLTAVPLHLLAYWVARHKGHDIDQPRNLAKSVTVE